MSQAARRRSSRLTKTTVNASEFPERRIIMNLPWKEAQQTKGKRRNGKRTCLCSLEGDCKSEEPGRRGGGTLGLWVRGRGTAGRRCNHASFIDQTEDVFPTVVFVVGQRLKRL